MNNSKNTNSSTIQDIRTNTQALYLRELFKTGIEKMRTCKGLTFWLFIGWLCVIRLITIMMRPSTSVAAPLFAAISDFVGMFVLPFAIIAATIFLSLLILYLGTPIKALSINRQVRQAGLKNDIGESPLLVQIGKFYDRKNITAMVFLSLGVTPADVEDLQPNIETALDRFIVGVEPGACLRYLIIYTVPADTAFPKVLEWKDEYLG